MGPACQPFTFSTVGIVICIKYELPKSEPGLHKLWYPGIRDTSTWSKFGAHGEHGDVFLFSNLGAVWFSENLIRYSLHICLLKGGQEQSFFLQKLIYGISRDDSKKFNIRTCDHMWSSVSSGYEHVPQLMQPWSEQY